MIIRDINKDDIKKKKRYKGKIFLTVILFLYLFQAGVSTYLETKENKLNEIKVSTEKIK